MEELFHRLLTTAAPSGYEGAVQEVYKELMAPYVDSIETDNMGNVIAVKKGPEGSQGRGTGTCPKLENQPFAKLFPQGSVRVKMDFKDFKG